MADKVRLSADDRLASELAAGKSVRDAASSAELSERTVYRRLAEKKFANRVQELRDQMVSRCIGILADSMAGAAVVLVALLKSESEGIRLRASVALIELGLKVKEVEELQRRLEDLERWREGGGR